MHSFAIYGHTRSKNERSSRYEPYTFLSILNKSENATLQYYILFCENVLDKKYLLKLNNVSHTSSKRFVETPPIRLF